MSSKLIEYGIMGFALFSFMNKNKAAPAPAPDGGGGYPGSPQPAPPTYGVPSPGSDAQRVGQWLDVVESGVDIWSDVVTTLRVPTAPAPVATSSAPSDSGNWSLFSWFK